ncbi:MULTISPECIES: TRAP transporter small permease [Alphaproteobacteria]|uniref:TRAP transporter small permease protein n=2 Tax=Alphaproteobacteria TaxID=28211 RepID=A0A512HHA2_9HYPH|nr:MULTISPECIES: TRAP transporter small permease [Alphaproteobacteria]GEO84770.1 hypothetical protein RNA01_17020 [Ciceribacter naphthalenivorans]GLR20609.1 hypothetical protein GCM10007920_03930 [Ciceribacter naphthalenivorans]GLT03465.1 hypothetical protein GCM10007926_03930 [Sphingomonas psychrolutea]
MTMLRFFAKGADLLAGAAAILAGISLLFITAVILIDVIGRYFGSPFYGARDLVQMAAVIVVFGGMAYADRNGGHIQVDILEQVFSPGLNRVLTAAGYMIGAVVFALIGWNMWAAAEMSALLNMSTNLLNLPRGPFEQITSILAWATALCLVERVLDRVFGAKGAK